MMGRRNWTLVTVLTVCAIAAAGCHRSSRRGGSTTNHDDDIFTTDSFPGDDVQNGNVADDGRAFSPSGQDFSGGMKCTYNGDRGTVMVTYVTDGVNVYAQYYDGASWTPPVSLNAIDITTTSAALFSNEIIHAFINTDNANLSSEAQARNGDCLIIWQANDVDSDGVGSDGINTCLFSTYFDVTAKDDVSANHGFQVFADRLNFEDEVGEDVVTVGLVTDGLCGEARWNAAGSNYSYGDQTTSIVVVWMGANFYTGASYDDNLHGVRFDLEQLTAEDLPLVPGADAQLPIATFGASNGGLTANESMAAGEFITYNSTFFFKVFTEITGGGYFTSPGFDFGPFRDFGTTFVYGDEDITIQYLNFDLETSTFTGPFTVNLGGVSTSGDNDDNLAEFIRQEDTLGPVGTNDPFFLNGGRSCYGSDEGLAATVLLYLNLINDPDAETEFGEGALLDPEDDCRLCIAEVDADTGVLLEAAIISATDPDIGDNIDEGDIDTRISRNGDYIWVAWLQFNESGGSNEVGLHVCQYQTTRIQDDGTIPVPPTLATSLSPDFNASSDFDGDSVHWFMFQDCLGYICGQQSDPDIMHIFYEQSEDFGADNIDDVFVTTLDADVTGFPTAAVVTVGATWQVFETGDQPGNGQINDEHFCFNATDSGEGGNIFSVYTEDVDGSLVTVEDFRLIGDGSGLNGGFDEIDSEVSFRQSPQQNLTLVCTPPGSAIGVFDTVDMSDSQDRPHAASNIHVLFAENESTETSGLGFALRTRQFRTDDGAALAFSERFVPNATTGVSFEFPFDLDLPNIDPNTGDDASVVGIGVCDDVVGVWFTEESHIYYQEFAGNNGDQIGWVNIDAESNPFLVDDDNDEELQSFVTFCTKSCTCCDLDGALVFWTKAYGSGSGGGLSQRLQVRVRTSGSGN